MDVGLGCRSTLAEHGIQKIVPAKEALDKAYRLFDGDRRLQEAYDKVKTEVDTAGVSAPDDIEKRVAKILKDHPTLRWDAAVMEVQKVGGNVRRRVTTTDGCESGVGTRGPPGAIRMPVGGLRVREVNTSYTGVPIGARTNASARRPLFGGEIAREDLVGLAGHARHDVLSRLLGVCSSTTVRATTVEFIAERRHPGINLPFASGALTC